MLSLNCEHVWCTFQGNDKQIQIQFKMFKIKVVTYFPFELSRLNVMFLLQDSCLMVSYLRMLTYAFLSHVTNMTYSILYQHTLACDRISIISNSTRCQIDWSHFLMIRRRMVLYKVICQIRVSFIPIQLKLSLICTIP